ncbi:MAG: protein kinase [Anaerolineaceae bacterium]|nr:protein kinase [Anaerolineaceae bacterium]
MSTPSVLNERYQLLESLGNGGMALVFKAKDLMLERNIAVKLLREDYSKDLAFRERFRQEARSAANLTHPNIVTVHDFGLDQGYLFIVMEYVPGNDLKSLIRQKGQLSVQESLELIIQACQGVGYAHRAGLVHCDIKPHNMLVTPEGRLKVTDFGIARALASIDPEERSDVVWGSPHYFSPEQAAGFPPSPASDVYSLGVILYELLTGNLPFTAKDSADLARMHREATPIPPRLSNLQIPQALDDLVMKVLSKEPSSRYRTADQMGRVLQNLYENNPALRRSNSYLTQGFNVVAGRPLSLPLSEPAAESQQEKIPSSAQEAPQEVHPEEGEGEVPSAQPGSDSPQPSPAHSPASAKPQAAEPLPKPDAQSPASQAFKARTPVSAPLIPGKPAQSHPQAVPVQGQKLPPPLTIPEQKPLDWLTWLLGLAAIVLLLGLIPFWMYIYWVLQG